MQLKGIHLFRLRGIDVVIDYSWFVIFFLVVYTVAESYFPSTQQNYTAVQYWIMGLCAAILFFLSVLLHELAHSFVALKHGIRVISIRLFIFGGLAQVASEPESGRHEFLIALAGPAVSLGLGFGFGLLYGTLWISGKAGPVSAVAGYLAETNILLAIFNLIPGFPLDGGRILRAILWDRWANMTRATRVVSQIGNAFALFLISLGILLFLVTQSLVAGLWFVLVNDYIYRHKYSEFPVFNRDELIGMVMLAQVKAVPKELWMFKQVRDIMTPIEQVPSLKPSDDATEAFRRMMSGDLGRMPVIEEGRLVGIISRRDLLDLFKIKSDLGIS
jgi:Zn-dependent protease